jgi:hypothetical protein
MRFFPKKLAGAGYVVLNVIRVMNIIALLTVIAASSVMLVKTFIVSKFFFFDACEHIIRIIMSGMCLFDKYTLYSADFPTGFLITTELSIFKPWIAKNWPLFSPRSSFVMLGVGMIFLGNSVLGNLNKQATSQESIGLPFWRLVIASGIVVFVMGFINLFAVRGLPAIVPHMLTSFAEFYLPGHQSKSHGTTSSFSRCSRISQGGCRSFHTQTTEPEEPLSVLLPRQQARLSSVLFSQG